MERLPTDRGGRNKSWSITDRPLLKAFCDTAATFENAVFRQSKWEGDVEERRASGLAEAARNGAARCGHLDDLGLQCNLHLIPLCVSTLEATVVPPPAPCAADGATAFLTALPCNADQAVPSRALNAHIRLFLGLPHVGLMHPDLLDQPCECGATDTGGDQCTLDRHAQHAMDCKHAMERDLRKHTMTGGLYSRRKKMTIIFNLYYIHINERLSEKYITLFGQTVWLQQEQCKVECPRFNLS